ncbi:MAG: hypothetical protein SPLUMA2_SPLUMAMAG2_00301 [uncultured Sulfurimonas sp.]|nr:MAG: hypothetical protein SPLUMA2_SPLUMAMAG2_00301 [uncultured Sulfurimonas sp.]
MNILLINDNPVVNKLVTLSAQKTSDNLEVVDSLENLESSTYDLVVIDDTLYSDELHMELNAKVQYSSSLYICARDAEEVSDFTKILKKPFLPTDLVELFSVLSKVVDEIDLSVLDEHENEASLELQELEDEIEELESLDEELDLGELEDDLEEEMTGDRILDDEEAQKVKDLLEETDMNIDDELLLEAEEEIDIDIASQIENSVENLSEEDLESEIDEGTLLNIVSGDLDSLTSRDMKIAVGEDVDSVEAEVLEEDTASIEEEIEEDVRVEETVIEENKGVEALKNLLAALSDKNVAASMKGMKISINITLGDD